MDENQTASFAQVLAAELAQIVARRLCAGNDHYPFASEAAARAAWTNALDAGKKARQSTPAGDEIQAMRTAWQTAWDHAERELLRPIHGQLEQKRAQLSQGALGAGQRQNLEQAIATLEKTLQEAKERNQWKQTIDSLQRSPANDKSSDPAQANDHYLAQVQGTAGNLELVGLAFSGGGIRSATFNLGILQGLAELGLLGFVDYLSTVSGGGYIGGWLTAWIRREGGLAKVVPQLDMHHRTAAAAHGSAAQAVEPGPIWHLRQHTNYLAPRQGFFSADIWVLWAIYLRNFLLNQLVLLPAALAVLLLVRFVMLLYYPWGNAGQLPNLDEPGTESLKLMRWFGAATGGCWFLGLVWLLRGSLGVVRLPARASAALAGRLGPGGVMVVALLVMVGAILVCAVAPYPLRLQRFSEASLTLNTTAVIALCVGVAVVAFATLFILNRPRSSVWKFFVRTLRLCLQSPGWPAKWRLVRRRGRPFVRSSLLLVLAGATGGVAGGLFVAIHGLLPWLLPPASDALTDCAWLEFALPCTVLAAVAFVVAALHRALNEQDMALGRLLKELLCVAVSGFVGGFVLYWVYFLLHSMYRWDGLLASDSYYVRATANVMTCGPPLILGAIVLGIYAGVGLAKGQLKESGREWWSSVCARLLMLASMWLAVNFVALYATPLVLWAGPWLGSALGSGWLLTVASGVVAGKAASTGNGHRPNLSLELLARTTPYVFVGGLLVGLSVLLHNLVDNPPPWYEAAEEVLPRRLDPEWPSRRVVVASRTGKERRETTEHSEVIDTSVIAQDMYWAGMLNTEPRLVPYLNNYQLFSKDLARLDRHQVDYNVLDALCVLVGQEYESRDDFEKALNDATAATTPRLSEAHRALVLQYAKNVVWMQTEVGLLSYKLGWWLLGCLVVLVVAALRVDVNLFSLHALYGNRLVRAYLGAARHATRRPDPVIGFDPEDNIPLHDMAVEPFGPQRDRRGFDGPYPLVNTALNLVHGDEQAWQERKAASFVFTPRHCGSETTNYRPTSTGYARNVTLGNVMTISGAAASPNMGYHSSSAITVLLTVFNARLGAWVGNPRSAAAWHNHGPWFGFWPLCREVFGLSNDKDDYVYLSDGGHFENLGVYELVRRRCRFIIASDASQDGDHQFEDLGNLVRKCRIDFGIRIEIDLQALQLANEPRRCRWHCAVGTIHYEEMDEQASPGTLVYIKPSLTGDEPADVLQYAKSQPSFPHETTANQFYTESQFESYRILGYHIAHAVFEQSVPDMREQDGLANETSGAKRERHVRALFGSVMRRWFAMPPKFETGFVEVAGQYTAIHQALRTDHRLKRLSRDLYPECRAGDTHASSEGTSLAAQAAASGDGQDAAELHMVMEMLQVMENAWLSLNLDVTYAHPLNRGWMDVFHRWTSAPTVRRLWPILRAEVSRGFVAFCEKQMRLGEVVGQPIELHDTHMAPWQWKRLCVEFQDQWPEELSIEARLRLAEDDQDRSDSQRRHWAWLVYLSNPYPGQERPAPDAMPCGVIHIASAATDAAAPDGGCAFELFVWIRGAYRNTGLGRKAVATILDSFAKRVGGTFSMHVRLPVAELRGSGGVLQREMWLTFFYHLGFRRMVPPAEDAAQTEHSNHTLVLERRFDQPNEGFGQNPDSKDTP